MLVDYTVNGVKKILGGSICMDRPYSGLDAKPGWGWRDIMDAARETVITTGKTDIFTGKGSVIVRTPFSGDKLRGVIEWTVYGDGSVVCALDGQVAEGLRIPRLGVEFTVPGSMGDVDYTGYGPMENYSDRMLAPFFGKYVCKVEDLGYDFAPPSENGGHEGTVALKLGGENGVSFKAENPFHFDAHYCTVEDLKQAMHTHDVPRRENITVHLDAYHMPIGGDMAWSTMLDPAEVPHAAFHSLRVVIK